MSRKTFILGLSSRLKDSAFFNTKLAYEASGHNTGNFAFHYAIDKHLGGASACGWGESPEVINAMGDIAVMPCANQVGAHADYGSLGEKFKRLEVGVVAIGLGAQSGADWKIPEVPEGTLNWIREIAKRSPGGAPNIGVRGEFTKRVLEHYGLGDSALVTGCPTLFINSTENLGEIIASRIGEPKKIAVAAGHPRWKHLSKIEASLAHMVTATNGSYVGQSPFEMVQLTRGEASVLSAEDLALARDYACPEMSIDEFVKWADIYGNVFFDTEAWMEHYRRFDFVVGCRIHGVMLALQAGVPGLCIAHDSRTIELCETMMVPYVKASEVSGGISRDSLMRVFKFDSRAFDENRKRLHENYAAFWASNLLSLNR
ncbi:polysaccharide pyruvyl transferase family protein [Niveibacterium sp. SC-1]|uniref:polysaccharide pyruvyl transferase family protein n=1 Tax=Niveibacterium sp. SC-1 TaxID=3135646 RepID=UPI00311E1031